MVRVRGRTRRRLDSRCRSEGRGTHHCRRHRYAYMCVKDDACGRFLCRVLCFVLIDQAIQQMMRDFMEAKMQEQGAPTPGIDDEQHTSDEEGAGHTPMPSIPQNVPPGCIEFLGQFLGGLIGKDPMQVEKFLRDQLRQDPAIKHISIQVLPVHHRQQGGFPFGGMQPPWPQRTEEDTQAEEK